MPKYTIETEWSGYSRGYAIYEVEAKSKEDAREVFEYDGGTLLEEETVRDDTNSEIMFIKKVKEDA